MAAEQLRLPDHPGAAHRAGAPDRDLVRGAPGGGVLHGRRGPARGLGPQPAPGPGGARCASGRPGRRSTPPGGGWWTGRPRARWTAPCAAPWPRSTRAGGRGSPSASGPAPPSSSRPAWTSAAPRKPIPPRPGSRRGQSRRRPTGRRSPPAPRRVRFILRRTRGDPGRGRVLALALVELLEIVGEAASRGLATRWGARRSTATSRGRPVARHRRDAEPTDPWVRRRRPRPGVGHGDGRPPVPTRPPGGRPRSPSRPV